MRTMPQMAPVSDLRNKHREVFGMLDKGPVLLAARSKAQAVLVGLEEWNGIAARLELLEQLQEARRILADGTPTISSEEMRARMAKHGVFVES